MYNTYQPTLLFAGNYPKAEIIFQNCLKLMESTIGVKDSAYLSVMSHLAGTYAHQYQYSKAETLYNHCLEMQKYYWIG